MKTTAKYQFETPFFDKYKMQNNGWLRIAGTAELRGTISDYDSDTDLDLGIEKLWWLDNHGATHDLSDLYAQNALCPAEVLSDTLTDIVKKATIGHLEKLFAEMEEAKANEGEIDTARKDWEDVERRALGFMGS